MELSETRCILHVDMDAFFASVEQRDNPRLRGLPVIVGADPKKGAGRGVVSTCSYEARRSGVHSAMPISTAFRLCPQGVYLPVDMEKYRRVSEQISAIFNEFSPLVEPVSIDEAFLDLTSTSLVFDSPYAAAVSLKKRIFQETGLTASVGIAPTKMAAKIASDLKKPDGLVEVKPGELRAFLRPLPVGKMWGLGKKSGEILGREGITTIGALADADPQFLVRLFGKNGFSYWERAQGKDDRGVETDSAARSMSSETTFEKDTADTRLIECTLVQLCEDVSQRLRQNGLQCRTVTLKIRTKGFQTYTRSCTLSSPTNFTETLARQAKQLYRNFEFRSRLVRLIGVKASQLVAHEEEISLFPDKDRNKKEEVHRAVDKIKARFGDGAIVRAGRFQGNK